LKENIQSNIKTVRELTGLSQAAFSKLFNGTKDMVFSYEKGAAAPSQEAISVASELIGITTEEFGKKRLRSADYNKEEIKRKAKVLLTKNEKPAPAEADLKDKYITLLEQRNRDLENQLIQLTGKEDQLREVKDRLDTIPGTLKMMTDVVFEGQRLISQQMKENFDSLSQKLLEVLDTSHSKQPSRTEKH
jgi:transcriptional regulator with XRE-family HTH domain